ncbi:MAG: Eco47II family restriction endonuclease [Nitrospirae bacterium]|nr:Eco47II family restriction endonuclease [Nitrospirota bacterium]
MSYNLKFISDNDLYDHVKNTAEQYRFKIDLSDFNSNLVDAIKLTFDSKVYDKSISEVVESEVIRQLDKSNTNHIGYFHQNIFKYLGDNQWTVPQQGYDIVNLSKNIFVEMKNKHNTMNSSSSKNTYLRMQSTIIDNPQATCMLVEVIAKNSQNIEWKTTIDSTQLSNSRIRRVSIDKFYELVTGERDAFKQLCEVLPKVLSDVVIKMKEEDIETFGNPRIQQNTVLKELKNISNNIMQSIYIYTFTKYEGFDDKFQLR